MLTLDHVAVVAEDVARSVRWYQEQAGARVLYQDETWAFLKVGGSKLAIVSAHQHPPHVAFSVSAEALASAARVAGVEIDTHRDGTRGIYLADPSGNVVELIHYPAEQTIDLRQKRDSGGK